MSWPCGLVSENRCFSYVILDLRQRSENREAKQASPLGSAAPRDAHDCGPLSTRPIGRTQPSLTGRSRVFHRAGFLRCPGEPAPTSLISLVAGVKMRASFLRQEGRGHDSDEESLLNADFWQAVGSALKRRQTEACQACGASEEKCHWHRFANRASSILSTGAELINYTQYALPRVAATACFSRWTCNSAVFKSMDSHRKLATSETRSPWRPTLAAPPA